MFKFIVLFFVSYIFWQRSSLYLLATGLNRKKETIKKITDKTLLELIFGKTKLKLESIRISSSDKPWGMMIGLPKNPYMILSQNLYDSFNAEEVEYVVLHEAGHYLLAHSAKLAVTFIRLIVFGYLSIIKINNPIVWLLVAIVVGVLLVQVSRIFEYQADAFALKHISNPEGMITATHKFEKAYASSDWPRHDEDTLLGKPLYIGVPYNQRVRNAEVEIARRKNNIKNK